MLYGNYCYIIIENFPQKFTPRGITSWIRIEVSDDEYFCCPPGINEPLDHAIIMINFTLFCWSDKAKFRCLRDDDDEDEDEIINGI